MRIIGINLELATATILSFLLWLAYCHYPLLPPLDAYESASSPNRRSPAIGLLAAGAVEIRQVADKMHAAIGVAPGRRNEKMSAPSASMQQAVSKDENGLLPFVAPTSILAADPHKRNRSRYAPVSDTIRCYSCMSPFYESAWVQSLSRVYAKPMNFSQQCDAAGSLKGISLVECPSICVKMSEDVELSGLHFRGYIRGCYDTMLLHGFNQTLVRWFRWLQRDSCLDYNKYHILQLPPNPPPASRSQPKLSTLHICTCYADSCNGSPRYSGAGVTRLTWLGHSISMNIAATLGSLMVLLCWWCRTTNYLQDLNFSKSNVDLLDESTSRK